MSALFTSAFLSCVINVIVLPTLPSPSSVVLLVVPNNVMCLGMDRPNWNKSFVFRVYYTCQ